MKNLLFLLLFAFSTSVFAIPLTCVSEEKVDNVVKLRFKINDKVVYTAFNGDWDLYKIGVTPALGLRKIVYGSGIVDGSRISLTFVKQDFVVGKAIASFNKKKGYYTGEAGIDAVDHGRILAVKCIDSDREELITN